MVLHHLELDDSVCRDSNIRHLPSVETLNQLHVVGSISRIPRCTEQCLSATGNSPCVGNRLLTLDGVDDAVHVNLRSSIEELQITIDSNYLILQGIGLILVEVCTVEVLTRVNLNLVLAVSQIISQAKILLVYFTNFGSSTLYIYLIIILSQNGSVGIVNQRNSISNRQCGLGSIGNDFKISSLLSVNRQGVLCDVGSEGEGVNTYSLRLPSLIAFSRNLIALPALVGTELVLVALQLWNINALDSSGIDVCIVRRYGHHEVFLPTTSQVTDDAVSINGRSVATANNGLGNINSIDRNCLASLIIECYRSRRFTFSLCPC